MRFFTAIVLLAVFGGVADAGPLRQWIQDRRPGILIPKQAASFPVNPHACNKCTVCGNNCACAGGGSFCADGKCPVQFRLVGPSCPDGKCPLPKK